MYKIRPLDWQEYKVSEWTVLQAIVTGMCVFTIEPNNKQTLWTVHFNDGSQIYSIGFKSTKEDAVKCADEYWEQWMKRGLEPITDQWFLEWKNQQDIDETQEDFIKGTR